MQNQRYTVRTVRGDDPRRSIAGSTSAAVLIVFLLAALSPAAEPQRPHADQIKAAVEKSIALVEKSSAVYRNERQCFGCHHQAAPVLLLTEARSRGFAIDEENFAAQLDHTAAHLRRGRDSYLAGQGQGGKADTAGWALWTLETGGRKPDESTAAVAHFLLAWNKDRDHWRTSGNRPPTEASDFATTYVALRGLQAFGTAEQRDDIAARRERALKWLVQKEAQDTEDRVFRLRSLHYFDADEQAIESAAKDLVKEQAADGGWGQLPGMTSDAYATGTALVALSETGQLSAEDPEYQQGVEFLLRTQQDDGSWHVATRSRPIQVYFESGFPHGKDQFISISATSWAATALVLAWSAPPR